MEDEKIISLYWARDEQAISATSEKYGSYCASIAENILSSKEDAEECVSDTYLNAWNNIPPCRPGNLRTFLGKIVRNLSIDRYRYNNAEKRGRGEAAAVFDEMAEMVSAGEEPEERVNHRELVKTIGDFLGSLPPEKRKIMVCRYWYFDSVSDIARRFGKSENSVSVTLNRLRKQLRVYLAERGFEI